MTKLCYSWKLLPPCELAAIDSCAKSDEVTLLHLSFASMDLRPSDFSLVV